MLQDKKNLTIYVLVAVIVILVALFAWKVFAWNDNVQAKDTPSITELRAKQADFDMELQSAKVAQADAQKALDNATKQVDEIRIERQKLDQQIVDAINAPLGLMVDQTNNQ